MGRCRLRRSVSYPTAMLWPKRPSRLRESIGPARLLAGGACCHWRQTPVLLIQMYCRRTLAMGRGRTVLVQGCSAGDSLAMIVGWRM